MRSIIEESSRNSQQISTREGVEENDDRTNDDPYIVPKFQKLASLISAVNAMILFSLGSSFLLLPRKILSLLINIPTSQIRYKILTEEYDIDYNNDIYATTADVDDNILDCVTRMVGGVLVAQAMGCFILLYSVFVEDKTGSDEKYYSRMVVRNVRTSIAIESITGLLWIIVGLLNDRSYQAKQNEADPKTTFGLLLVGFCLLLLSCLSLMLSFWPAVDNSGSTTTQGVGRRVVASNAESSTNDLVEPLLAGATNSNDVNEVHNETETDEEEQRQSNETSVNTDAGSNSQTNPQNEPSEDEPTSRIRGTRRLLALAAPQVVYLYIGCITLLIRLPFSLSIPHFVSTTLGSLSRGEYDRARREVLWLFILGTIDACLDFWCIFWFGYANLRIVRGVRIDTFSSMLKQDIGFFDGHTSGELASRLTSDCGEMSGDLVRMCVSVNICILSL